MKIFFVLLSIVLGALTNFAQINVSPIVDICGETVENGFGSCTVKISTPEGWKFPCAPKIKVQNADDFSDISQKAETEGKTEYVFHLSAKIGGVKTMILEIESPMCSKSCVYGTCTKNINFGNPRENENFSWHILLGFLGGILLNIMPCVLPVILMKLRAFQSKIALIGSICGNFVSFSVLTAGLCFLKSVGTLAGWGMHFQSTGFLAATAVLLLLLTLYAFGIIHFSISVNIENNSQSVFWKNFVSSAIAAFVAIPCTAPLLGTAAAFAIQGTYLQLILVFSAIAAGFSLPYIFVLLFNIKMPHIPGRIGAIFDKIAGVGVLITFLWILWLLFRNITAPAANFERTCQTIRTHVAQNNVVMLNITADWCLTCQYNHKYVLGSEDVKKALSENNVKFVEVNITKKDDSVTEFLHKHRRVGIPFTMIYGPRAQDGILLNEIPSSAEVINAISKAK